MADISIETLRELLRYDPKTGKLFWRERSEKHYSDSWNHKKFNNKYAYKEAGKAKDSYGYRRLMIFKVSYSAHRVAYALHHGHWPKGEVDHINGVRDDNRISNLRDVTRSQNQRNQSVPSNSTSGNIGVRWYARINRWMAYIRVNGKLMHLGCFVHKQDALTARADAEKKYGFHENHGRAAA